MTSTFTRRTFGSMLAAAGLAAVTNDRGTAEQQAASPAASPAPIMHPTGAADLVMRVDISGGLIPVEFLLTALPGLSLYGDGTLIFLGPQVEIFPPPALPNLRAARLTEPGIQLVLAEAEQAGLFEGSHTYYQSPARDAPTTTIYVNADNQSIVVMAYALGIGTDPAWSDAERTARAKLFAFTQRMAQLPHSLPGTAIAAAESTYRIDRLQVVTEPYTAPSGAGTPTAAATPTPMSDQPHDWPLSLPLSELGAPYQFPGHLYANRCAEIGGQDAATLVNALQTASALTPWRSEGKLYRLLIRPLLPDETACRPIGHATPAATPSQ